MTSTVPAPAIMCRSCGLPLVSERKAAPWCQRCEWRLDFYDPDRRRRDMAFPWQDRLAFRIAYRQNARQFAALAGRGATKPALRWDNLLVLGFSLLMLALVASPPAAHDRPAAVGALAGQQRVALIGHELAHFVNGDVRRGPLASLAFDTLWRLSVVTDPSAIFGGRGGGGPIMMIAEALGRVALRIVHESLVLAQALATALALRSTQRAEYYADALAARVAGTQATLGLLDTLAASDSMGATLRSSLLRGEDPAQRAQSMERARADLAPMMPRLRQLTVREGASLFATHPPEGLRIRMVESRPIASAAVVLGSPASVRIGEELSRAYRYVGPAPMRCQPAKPISR